MKTVKIAYSNMWGSSSAFHAGYIADCFPCLRPHFRFELSSSPEFVFHSVYGYLQNRDSRGAHFVYAGEPGDHFGLGPQVEPGVYRAGFFRWGITCSADEPSVNHRYMPQGLLHLNLFNDGVASLIRKPDSPLPRKEFFCDFIYSNGNSRYRVDFFHALSRYKRVESCGHVERNNQALAGAAYSKQGYLIKQAFQARCKFSIAMENTVFPGYNTEKLTDPLVARSVPIYWGDPAVERFFNPKAFINVQSFPSVEAAIEHIIAVDKDDALYQAYLLEPPFVGNVVPGALSDEAYLSFFQGVFGS